AVEIKLYHGLRRFATQILKCSPLNYSKQELLCSRRAVRGVPVAQRRGYSFASLCPARCQLSAPGRVVVLARIRNAFIQYHRDVAAERGLNFHCDLRRNERSGAIDVILEFHAV